MTSADRFEGQGRNRLLTSLPPGYHERFLPRLTPVTLEYKQVLHETNEPIADVYFPLTAVISLLSVLADGATVEVATVGNEGLVGVPVLLGARSMPGRAICQVPGQALRMAADAFRDELARDGPLREVLNRYTQGLINQIAQSAACNRAHPIEERCARWLLMTHDRAGSDQFPLTQEFLAQMLGVRRATVNVAAGMLQKAGLIRYTRGRITIADRAGLEAASCECYRIIRDEFDRLLG